MSFPLKVMHFCRCDAESPHVDIENSIATAIGKTRGKTSIVYHPPIYFCHSPVGFCHCSESIFSILNSDPYVNSIKQTTSFTLGQYRMYSPNILVVRQNCSVQFDFIFISVLRSEDGAVRTVMSIVSFQLYALGPLQGAVRTVLFSFISFSFQLYALGPLQIILGRQDGAVRAVAVITYTVAVPTGKGIDQRKYHPNSAQSPGRACFYTSEPGPYKSIINTERQGVVMYQLLVPSKQSKIKQYTLRFYLYCRSSLIPSSNKIRSHLRSFLYFDLAPWHFQKIDV